MQKVNQVANTHITDTYKRRALEPLYTFSCDSPAGGQDQRMRNIKIRNNCVDTVISKAFCSILILNSSGVSIKFKISSIPADCIRLRTTLCAILANLLAEQILCLPTFHPLFVAIPKVISFTQSKPKSEH